MQRNAMKDIKQPWHKASRSFTVCSSDQASSSTSERGVVSSVGVPHPPRYRNRKENEKKEKENQQPQVFKKRVTAPSSSELRTHRTNRTTHPYATTRHTTTTSKKQNIQKPHSHTTAIHHVTRLTVDSCRKVSPMPARRPAGRPAFPSGSKKTLPLLQAVPPRAS